MKFSSLKDLIKNKKIGLHIYFIAIAVILLFALLFGCIFGFNKSFDFTGGTQIVVDFGNDTLQSDENKTIDEYIDSASNKSKEIISKFGGKVYSLQVQDTNFGKSLVINIRQKSASTIRQIRLALNEEFNDYNAYTSLQDNEKYKILDDYYDLTKNTVEIQGLIIPSTVIACIASLLFVLAVMTIYCCFRFKLANGILVAFGGVLDLMLFCAFMILSRIEINTYFFALLCVVLLISIYNNVEFIFDIREKLKNPKFDSKTNEELSDIVLRENFIKNISIYGVCAVIAIVVGLFGVVPILHLGLATIFALVILFITHNLILPDFWVLINKKNNLVRPVPKQKKKDVEIDSKKNNIDKTAKVVEVEDDELEEDNSEEETKSEKQEEVEIESEEEQNNNEKADSDDEVIIEVLEDDTKKD